MQIFFRTLNTLFLAGIFSMLILIFVHLEKPIQVDQPVSVQGWHGRGGLEEELLGGPEPILVATHNKPLQVEIDNEPLQVEITR
jgi:hypothetical protein